MDPHIVEALAGVENLSDTPNARRPDLDCSRQSMWVHTLQFCRYCFLAFMILVLETPRLGHYDSFQFDFGRLRVSGLTTVDTQV
jgi:hypothetical protein